MISNGEKLREGKSGRHGWHYIAVIKRKISKHHGDIYCLNCFHSFARKNKLECHKRVCLLMTQKY